MTTSLITLYGFPNCDTVKKSRIWFSELGLDYSFYDFKKHGVPIHRLPEWMAAAGWEKLVNHQGTTWRKLDPTVQSAVRDNESASILLQTHPSVIKRPVVEWQFHGHTLISVGFVPDKWLSWIETVPGV